MGEAERDYWILYCAQQRNTAVTYRGILAGMEAEEDSLMEKHKITDEEIEEVRKNVK